MTVVAGELVLVASEWGSCRGTSEIEAAVASQRRRLVRLARDLSPSEWHAATRCPRWDVQGVLLHIVWGNECAAAMLAGEPIPHQVDTLDPRLFPNAYVDEHAGDAVDDTIDALSASTDQLLAGLEAVHEDERIPFFYPWPVGWPIVASHLLWDSWLHERDILVPAGRPHGTTPKECRVAVAYGLLLTAFNASTTGIRLDEELVVGGLGSGAYAITIGDQEAVVRHDPMAPVSTEGACDSTELADSLAGRGREVASVVERRDELTTALSITREFFLAPA